MDQLDIAIHQTAHEADGGLPSLARKMGMGEGVLRNKCNPNAEHCPLGLRQAVGMMTVTGDLRILEAIAAMMDCRVTRRVPSKPVDAIEALLVAVAEQGDVARVVHAALADGRLTQRELAQVRQEISEAREALDLLESTLIGQSRQAGIRAAS